MKRECKTSGYSEVFSKLTRNSSPSASWHTDYRDTAYIYVGGLSFDLTEGDVVTIFSQYGEPVWLKLVRDKETGKSRGFAYLKYEDQRSTDLAVDNLGGAVILGRTLKVDHCRYKKRDDEDEDEYKIAFDVAPPNNDGETSHRHRHRHGHRKRRSPSSSGRRPIRAELSNGPTDSIKKEHDRMDSIKREHDEEDPMKDYVARDRPEELRRSRRRRSRDRHSSEHKHPRRH